MKLYSKINACRVCQSKLLEGVIDLGFQALTGVFPATLHEDVPVGPLELVRCTNCGLVQLRHSYDPNEMYGENYGYRSGLNAHMVKHLRAKAIHLENHNKLNPMDVVLDIGSNDGTLLRSYNTNNLKKIGIDPTGTKFQKYYPEDVKLIPDFFSADCYRELNVGRAKIITSIAMFYDLEDPIEFARQVKEVLDSEGIWHFEQSYLPLMLSRNSYDTICHEHIEYYSLNAINFILEKTGFKIFDININDINGGSIAISAIHEENTKLQPNESVIQDILLKEESMGLLTPVPFQEFSKRVYKLRDDLLKLLMDLKNDNKLILGYGASTKGNVTLQFCNINPSIIEAIVEVNEYKYGRYTPGTNIPIISEEDAFKRTPDCFLVLPWHFKDSILSREKQFINNGGRFIFPFPEVEIC